MPNGAQGCDQSQQNPLARATTRLFSREGQPFKKLNICLFKDRQGALRWLGVFVHSEGDRVLFFPGTTEKLDAIRGYYGDSLKLEKPFDFDHISLEPNRSKWHVTAPRSKDHFSASPKILPLDNHRVLWLGMSLATAKLLPLVSEITRVDALIPASDAQRRKDILHNAISGYPALIASLNEEEASSGTEEFMHFGIFVGPKGFDLYSGPELGFPFGAPFRESLPPIERLQLRARSHRLNLSESIDIQITTCPLPGPLGTNICFTGTSTTQTY